MITRDRFMGAPRRMGSFAGAQALRRFMQELQVRPEVAAHEAFVEMVPQRRDLGRGERPVARIGKKARGRAAVQVVRVSRHGLPPRTTRARGTRAARGAPGAGSPSNS